MMKRLTSTATLFLTLSGVVYADDVNDALKAAQTAYAAGDLSGAAAQLTTASKAIRTLQSAKLARFIPEPPQGWTREIEQSSDDAPVLTGLIGNSAKATYSNTQGDSFTLTLTADSPLVAQMTGILANPQMMAMMGKMIKIGGQSLLQQNSSLSALVGGRVLVQAEGMEPSAMQPVLMKMNFDGLMKYDS